MDGVVNVGVVNPLFDFSPCIAIIDAEAVVVGVVGVVRVAGFVGIVGVAGVAVGKFIVGTAEMGCCERFCCNECGL